MNLTTSDGKEWWTLTGGRQGDSDDEAVMLHDGVFLTHLILHTWTVMENDYKTGLLLFL